LGEAEPQNTSFVRLRLAFSSLAPGWGLSEPCRDESETALGRREKAAPGRGRREDAAAPTEGGRGADRRKQQEDEVEVAPAGMRRRGCRRCCFPSDPLWS
jgi:hypothetical protein